MVMEQDEREHWIRTGHAMFADFMQRVQTIERVGVKGMDASAEDKRVTLIDKRKVYASLDEIADLYVNEEKEMVLDFTESRALAVFQSPTPQRPMEYSGFRWSYFKTPSRLVRSQDFFYLETMKPFVDVHGRRGWAKCSHSIEHPMCPDNSTARGINRGRLFYSGVVFVESREKGVLETTFYYSLDTTSIPAFLLPIVMKQRGKNNAALINHYVKVARVSAYAEKTNVKKLKQQLVEEKRCGACSNPMPKFTSKTKCLFCKSYVCKRCVEIVSKNYMFDGESNCNSCMLCAESHGSKIVALVDDGESSSATDDVESQTFSDAHTPSSLGTANFHHAKNCTSSKRMDRYMSATPKAQPSNSRKLVDFGIDSFNLRRRELPTTRSKPSIVASPSEAAPLSSQTRPPATVSPSPTTPKDQQRTRERRAPSSRRHHGDRTVVESPQQRPSPRQRRGTGAVPVFLGTPVLEQQDQSSRQRRGTTAVPIPLGSSPVDQQRDLPRQRRGTTAVPMASGTSQVEHQPRHRRGTAAVPLFSGTSSVEPQWHSAEPVKVATYTRENPCDLSYLSAFKV